MLQVSLSAFEDMQFNVKLIFAGHRITKNNRLTHLGDTPAVDGRFAPVGAFSPCKQLL